MPIQQDDYALVLGIQDYPSGDLATLTSAVRDANRMDEWLRDQATGGGLPQSNCRKVVSQPNSDKPLHAEIDDHLEQLFGLVEQRGPGRRFYFYFSGHGMAANAMQAYLCLPKWSNRRRKAAIDSLDYWLMLADTGLFKEIVCLFDCCRSYKPNVGGMGSELGVARPDVQAADSKLFLGFAAEYLRQAFEAPDANGHSFFTSAFLSGVGGGACVATGGAPADRITQFLLSETPRLAQLGGKRQTPTVYNGFPFDTQPVFGAALPLGAVGVSKLVYVISVGIAVGREVVLVRPDETELAWDGSQPWRVEVGEGLHILQDKSSGRMLRLPRDLTQEVIHVNF